LVEESIALSDPPSFPALTAQQMAEVDRVMVEELGLDMLQLMEMAGYAVAIFAREHFLGGDPRGLQVLVLAGSGGNGGDGLVAARLLHGWGADVAIVLSHPPGALRGPAAHNLRIVERLGLPISNPETDDPNRAMPPLPETDLVIDALLGFGLSGPPTGVAAALIRAANDHPAPTLAVDLPSGLDATAGTPHDPCIRADATLTLALPKTGLLAPEAQAHVGELHVADIGVPATAYAHLGLEVGPIFAERAIVRLRPVTSLLAQGFDAVPPLARPEDFRELRERFEEDVGAETMGERP
jgi:NAD(P)H-hydrate epimerase